MFSLVCNHSVNKCRSPRRDSRKPCNTRMEMDLFKMTKIVVRYFGDFLYLDDHFLSGNFVKDHYKE